MAFGDITAISNTYFPPLTSVDGAGAVESGSRSRSVNGGGFNPTIDYSRPNRFAGDVDGAGLGTHIADGVGQHFTQIPGNSNSYATHTRAFIG